MKFEDRVSGIKQLIVTCLSKKNYSPESICVYHLSFNRMTLDDWRAEVEAYIDVEDGPYFFIFERRGDRLVSWINDTRKKNFE